MPDQPLRQRLVVMASYDPDGELTSHLRYQVEAWQQACNRLVVVTTCKLTQSAKAWLSERADVIERENYGYDFYSYREGLLSVSDLTEFDEVVICNDSYIGPLVPFQEIFESMDSEPCDFWGICKSERIEPHIQSFFVVFRGWVIRSKAFRRFWEEMTPESDRTLVIRKYEIGLSSTLSAAGFTMGRYYVESGADRRIGRLRMVWWALHRQMGNVTLWSRVSRLYSWAREPWNPAVGLADAALHEARLPLVKFDTLRGDPYGLAADRLLKLCRRQYPDAFKGVDDYMVRVSPHYVPRSAEVLRQSPRFLEALRWLVSYR